jgi:hypothetical protein
VTGVQTCALPIYILEFFYSFSFIFILITFLISLTTFIISAIRHYEDKNFALVSLIVSILLFLTFFFFGVARPL